MATKIKLNDTLRNNFLAAREAFDSKAARKAAWVAVRHSFSIPSGIRLKAEIDNPGSDDYLVLKDADNGLPLWRMDDGSVVASATEPVAPTPNQPTQDGSRFATTRAASGSVQCISVDDLVKALRGDAGDIGEYTFYPRRLPDGFPGVTGDGVVLDTTDRVLYFAG